MCSKSQLHGESVWTFKTRRFTVRLTIEPDYGYRYDGDDPEGETQAKLNSGEYIAFDSAVTVEFDGIKIAADHLGGSVYDARKVKEFWTAHRDHDHNNRNCSMHMDRVIGHYFPEMVRIAIEAARKHFANMPRLRTTTA